MALIQQLNTLRRAMQSADVTEPVYVFEDDEVDHSVIPIPVSLDQCAETIRKMESHQVAIESEKHRIEIELENITRELKRHRISMARVCVGLGVPSSLANEELD